MLCPTVYSVYKKKKIEYFRIYKLLLLFFWLKKKERQKSKCVVKKKPLDA